MTIRNKDQAPRFYQATKKASQFVANIQTILTEYGSDSFMVENQYGSPSAVAFQLNGLAYKIRPDFDAMAERLDRSRRKGRATPEAVAWAQAFHLLELQLEAIETGAARASEVLGGYVLMETGRTVGEMIEERAEELMPGERLLLPSGAA